MYSVVFHCVATHNAEFLFCILTPNDHSLIVIEYLNVGTVPVVCTELNCTGGFLKRVYHDSWLVIQRRLHTINMRSEAGP